MMDTKAGNDADVDLCTGIYSRRAWKMGIMVDIYTKILEHLDSKFDLKFSRWERHILAHQHTNTI